MRPTDNEREGDDRWTQLSTAITPRRWLIPLATITIALWSAAVVQLIRMRAIESEMEVKARFVSVVRTETSKAIKDMREYCTLLDNRSRRK